MIDKEILKSNISNETFYGSYFPQHKSMRGGEWLVLCPFHDDHKPSMNININKGLYHCHSCGAAGDVFEFYQKKTGKSFKETMEDLSDQYGVKPIETKKPKIVETYDYLDLSGNLVSQTVRLEPKRFLQRRRSGNSWVWNLRGVKTVLYNLQDVVKADKVLLVEGEKDCNTAKLLGIVATTNPMGAGKWEDRYTKTLAGKEVILIPDNDAPGIQHMKDVGEKLKQSTVKWLDLPGANKNKFDLTDYVETFDNEFIAMSNIDTLIRSARMFDPGKIIIPEPDTIESEKIKAWIKASPGEFSIRDLDYDLGFNEPKQKQLRTRILEKFVAEKLISREGKHRGRYRPYKKQLEIIDYINSEDRFLPLWLPMGIHKMVGIMPGNIIILAGEANSGKTAIALNIIKSNMNRFNVHYFNSEMGGGELHNRLKKFEDISLNEWNFNAYTRDTDFADVVFTGENSLNIIDFLEIHEDFFAVGEKIKQIHLALKGAIAVIAIQKNKGAEFGLGGNRTMEKARLVVNVSPGKFKITKAKNFINPDQNPNGLMCNWKLVQGCKFVATGPGWYKDKK